MSPLVTGGHGGWTRVKGVKYMVTERDLTSGGEHTMQYTGDVVYNCTLETYITLSTKVTPINLKKKKRPNEGLYVFYQMTHCGWHSKAKFPLLGPYAFICTYRHLYMNTHAYTDIRICVHLCVYMFFSGQRP